MKIVTAGVLAAAILLGSLPTQAGGFDAQTEGSIFLNEVAQILQMQRTLTVVRPRPASRRRFQPFR